MTYPMYTAAKWRWTLAVLSLAASTASRAQQRPAAVLELSPVTTEVLFPEDRGATTGTAFRARSVSAGAFAPVYRGLYLGADYEHRELWGDFEPYASHAVGLGARYYFRWGTLPEGASVTQISLAKRVSYFAEARYGAIVSERGAGDNRFRDRGEGAGVSVGVAVYPVRYFGIGYVLGVSEPNRALEPGRDVRIRHRLTLTVPINTYWPSSAGAPRNRPAPLPILERLELRPIERPALAAYARTGFTFIGDGAEREVSTEFAYSGEVGLLLPRGFEVGLQARRLASRAGPTGQVARESGLLYGVTAGYELPILNTRWKAIAAVSYLRGDWCSCGPLNGERRSGMDYVGGRGALRFVATPWLYLDASLTLLHLLDDAFDKFGLNYPELSATVPVRFPGRER